MTDKKAHTHKNSGNLSIRNQVGNLFYLKFFNKGDKNQSKTC